MWSCRQHDACKFDNDTGACLGILGVINQKKKTVIIIARTKIFNFLPCLVWTIRGPVRHSSSRFSRHCVLSSNMKGLHCDSEYYSPFWATKLILFGAWPKTCFMSGTLASYELAWCASPFVQCTHGGSPWLHWPQLFKRWIAFSIRLIDLLHGHMGIQILSSSAKSISHEWTHVLFIMIDTDEIST